MAINKISREPDYSDLDLDFIAHPTTGDVMKKKGNEAIKRSVRNLILTNFYDRPFVSRIGSNAQKLLFENGNMLTANFLKDAIREVIINFEPRIAIQNILVEFDYDRNGYNATLQYIILNRNEPVVTSLFLERIR
jgi:phage baseplate assembly protein W